jgi:S-adenosylmethionine-diacylglycerol 3-amino-3-carboxypropyl transferase
MGWSDRLTNAGFTFVHGHSLIYNTCWEDPRLDRVALGLGPDDTVVAITSAGCNVLDYALQSPRHLYAVDVNPRQNALLELKIAGIRTLSFETFFDLFGRGRLDEWSDVYHERLRPLLAPPTQEYWDRRSHYFTGPAWRQSFYFRGTAGRIARAMNVHLDWLRLRDSIDGLVNARSIEAQRDIYASQIAPRLWRPALTWLLGRDAALWFLAVPRAQREHLERDYPRGIASFIQERVAAVFTEMPLSDNYFWRVYLTGGYTRECCPEYLKEENFQRLKAGLVGRISIHTASIEAFLASRDEPISRYVLLDHMDWLCDRGLPALGAEWRQILRCAAPEARVIWRSGGQSTAFIDTLDIEHAGRRRALGSILQYARELAARLHAVDRVHTYGSFHIATVVG